MSQARFFCPDTPIMLVATKKDLRNNPRTIKELSSYRLKPVSYEQGKETASKIQAVAYVECSAKTGEVGELWRNASNHRRLHYDYDASAL